MFTRIKTALLIGLTMLFASSVYASIPRNTFRPEQLLSSVQNVSEKTDHPSENRVWDFSELTPVRTGLFTVQAYGMPWVVQGTSYKTASGRYILFFVDPYGLCAEQGGFSQWVDNAAWAASEWKTGIGEALYNLPANTWNTIAHPIQTVKNIPAGLSSAWDTMKSGDYGATGRLMGNITGNVEVGLAVGGAIKAAQTPSAGRTFWSGSPEARLAAESFAKSSGGTTLEMTFTGKILDTITTQKNYPVLKPLWDTASKNFAKGASGNANVFQSGAGVRVNSVWGTVEYPQLMNSGVPINYHVTP